MIEEIKTLLARVDELKAENEEQLEALRLEFLSKKGKVNQLVAEFRNVAADQKKEVGIYLNQLKTALQDRFNTLKAGVGNDGGRSLRTGLDAHALPHHFGNTPPALTREAGDHRHLRTHGLFACRRS